MITTGYILQIMGLGFFIGFIVGVVCTIHRQINKSEPRCSCGPTRKSGVHEDNSGIQECGDCGLLLPKQPYYVNQAELRIRIKARNKSNPY